MNKKKCFLKVVTETDYDLYYQIRSEKKNMYWTGYSAPPNYQNFKHWFIKRIHDKKKFLYLLICKSECAGSLNIDYYTDYAYIGYSIKENFEGQGLATFIVNQAIEIIQKNKQIKQIKAWINELNVGSIKVIEKNNFSKTGKTEYRNRFSKKELYYEYSLNIN